jgi:multiple sugar transport system substrate-binding protein
MNLTSFLTDSRRLVYVLGGAIALMVFITIIFILRNVGSTQQAAATLEVWGVFDESVAFTEAIKSFEKVNSGTKVHYKVIPYKDYEKTLLNALAAGQGPDIFMIHNTWLPQHVDKLRPMPASFPDTKAPLRTVRQFRDLFVEVAYNDLVNDNKIYAMPLYVDTLALYYNKDMFASAGLSHPPATWDEFMADVKTLTRLDASRNITASGAAIGSARNINRSTDILMMLMLQSGVQMTNDDGSQATFAHSVAGQPVGERALTFYTDFTNPQKEVYTWNDNQHYSVDAFAAGETAMMMNYHHQLAALREKAPRLNFGIAPMPQATATDRRTYADYWALGVAVRSKQPFAAWRFVDYMTAGAGNVSYLNAADRPAARNDLIEQQKAEQDVGVFAEQALTARSWFQVDNLAIETIFADMIDSVNLGRQSVRDALKEAEAKVTVLMSGR